MIEGDIGITSTDKMVKNGRGDILYRQDSYTETLIRTFERKLSLIFLATSDDVSAAAVVAFFFICQTREHTDKH